MESELTTFLTTIDTPAFRRNNLAKVRAKAAATQGSSTTRLPATALGSEPLESALPMTRLPAALGNK